MVKHLQTKLILLLCMLVAGVGNVWAGTSTVTASKVTSASATWTGSAGVTWNVSVSGGALNQNVTNSYAQVGTKDNKSSSMSFSTSGINGTITSIVIDCAAYQGKASLSVTVGGNAFGTQNQSAPSWSSNNSGGNVTFNGSATGAIVITMTNATNGRAMYIKSITVTYTANTKTKIAAIADDFATSSLDFNATGTFTRPTITPATGAVEGTDYEVEWSSSDENMLTIDQTTGGYFVGSTKGNVDVTVSVEPYDDDAYEAVSKTFTVKIVDPNAHTGLTQDDAFTVAEAIEAIDNGVEANTQYYVKGIISQVDSYNSQYNSITYWISDNGTTTNQMEVYSGKGLNNANFSAISDLSVGDEVVVKGNLKLFESSGSSIYEFDKNSQIVSLKTKATASLAFSPATLPALMVGDEDITLTLTTNFDGEILAISSDDDIATITENGTNCWTIHAVAKGDVTFTFMADATDAFKAIEEELEMTVKANSKVELAGTNVINDWSSVSGSYYDTATDVEIGNYVFNLFQCCKQTNLQFKANAGVLISPVITSENGYTVIIETTSDSNASGELTLQIGDENAVIAAGRSKSVMATTSSKSASFTIKNLHSGAMKVDKIIIMPNVNVTSFGWATYITPVAMTFETGNAFVVTEASVSEGLTTAEVTSVPANTPLLLKDTGVKSFALAQSPEAPITNLLTISDGTVEDGKYPYVLAKNGQSACFKQWTGDKSKLNGRVVLLLDETVAAARSVFSLDEEATTSISAQNMVRSGENCKVYNLNGQLVSRPSKGLYIVNGKKVVLK